MKKKIAILGSTGSIGKNTLNIINKDIKKFEIELLTTNSNVNNIVSQVKKFKVKNIIVKNKNSYDLVKKKLKKNKVKIFNGYNSFGKIFKNNKIDYAMSAISGFDGLEPTIKIIKFTKKIAIANKESIICAWDLIKKELIKNKSEFLPVDSEHFSIWQSLGGFNVSNVEKIYITASGGPFLNLPISQFKKVKPSNAINHPIWKMGKKISIDSSTMMNKVFEILEAQKIFNLKKKQLEILIHPTAYLHSIIKFNNGTSKLLVHETNMKIPIFNTLYDKNQKILSSKRVDIKKLNNLNLSKPDFKKFKLLNILNKFDDNNSLYDTVLVSANDELVSQFLNNNISYKDINVLINKILNFKEFRQLKRKIPQNINEIVNLNKYVRLKTLDLCIKDRN